jgi:hypothetical protein
MNGLPVSSNAIGIGAAADAIVSSLLSFVKKKKKKKKGPISPTSIASPFHLFLFFCTVFLVLLKISRCNPGHPVPHTKLRVTAQMRQVKRPANLFRLKERIYAKDITWCYMWQQRKSVGKAQNPQRVACPSHHQNIAVEPSTTMFGRSDTVNCRRTNQLAALC